MQTCTNSIQVPVKHMSTLSCLATSLLALSLNQHLSKKLFLSCSKYPLVKHLTCIHPLGIALHVKLLQIK
jgi:hypothetical protein